ncbi:hypothetical protein CR513_61452, partial [Mucuna pruriens]
MNHDANIFKDLNQSYFSKVIAGNGESVDRPKKSIAKAEISVAKLVVAVAVGWWLGEGGGSEGEGKREGEGEEKEGRRGREGRRERSGMRVVVVEEE